ncbi:hypothetical protein BV898_06985 [Hypsibius exemplaris]|uniref:Fibronectin type-III domain-containing protein n=1 Tax=Hypsibius exemplaris TaxID=2072580 RepID=A0A1W0WUQ3_HYPEX|nr:hypothetical protein BV898_06985 [Hypsibius exemplaris]
MTVYSLLPVLLAVTLTSAQQTALYGTVGYGSTKLAGFVSVAAAATTETPRNRQQQPQTYDPYSYQYAYTSPPEQFDRSRYGGAASASSGQSQAGRGVSAGGSASSSGSGQQRPYGSRYSGQAAASSYGGRQQPGRYEPGRYDPRRPLQQTDPRYNQGYGREQEQAVDYSRYPPTLKSLVLSETDIYLWWVDPAAQQSGGARRGQETATDKDVKYSVKYSKLYPRQGEQADEQTTEVSSARELHLKSLEPGTDYTFSIKTNRNGQETGWSAPVVNRTLEQLPVEPPTNIKVVPTDRDATITISPPENFKGAVSSYIFLYAPSGGNGGERKWEELQVRGGYAGQKEVTAVLRGLLPGEEYFYTVQAVNSRGSSQFSDIQSFKTTSGPVYTYPTRAPYGGGGDRDPYGRDRDREQQTTQSPYGSDRDEYGRDREDSNRNPYDQDRRQEEETTPDYYAAYRTTAYPGYEENTPDYYGRYPSDSRASTPDYYGRYQAATEDPYAQPSTPDYYAEALAGGSTVLNSFVTPPSQNGALYWSPYWAAATVPSSEQGGAVEPPTDVRVEAMAPNADAPGDQVEALVTFVASASPGIAQYEVLYTYDPTASDDLWQIDSIPGGESQGILVRLTPNARVYVKVRAKSAAGNSNFSEVVPLDTVAYGGQQGGEADLQAQGEQGGDQQAGGDQQGDGDHQPAEEDRDPADNADEEADTAHTRTNRT